jgi:hypothetical protein
MHRVLLGLAAITAIIAAPAAAQSLSASGFSGASAFGNAEFASSQDRMLVGSFSGVDRDGTGRGHSRHIHVGDGFAGSLGYAGGYYDEGDFDGNRSFDPDLWNDWWHNRPDRAFPRWVFHNQDCARLWWSGGGWRC